MAKSVIALIGGIIVLLGIVLSFFVDIFGWWNFYTIFADDVTDSYFMNAFFGDTDELLNEDLTYLIPGILASLGGILCLTQNKALSIIGGVLVIGGIGFYLILLGDSDAANLANNLDTNILWDEFGVTLFNSFTGVRWQLGYGMITTAVGGIVGIIGGLTAKK
ncbi:hypothetical protein NEF87_003050 [Candidatus Lokiarchaeum ossiferum]|uniref:DUF1772 domain-containing protein n=1 Tax=Candidatus Lokiarchaeum ossiferum TaxID=2951803 RepID=A0ABY6HTC8_9ARCH|nr:hypothetical protein NEF87_003050 [Candidatus Lokiarchaeum sp. B-35]